MWQRLTKPEDYELPAPALPMDYQAAFEWLCGPNETYVQHGRTYVYTLGSRGIERRDVTAPPNSNTLASVRLGEFSGLSRDFYPVRWVAEDDEFVKACRKYEELIRAFMTGVERACWSPDPDDMHEYFRMVDKCNGLDDWEERLDSGPAFDNDSFTDAVKRAIEFYSDDIAADLDIKKSIEACIDDMAGTIAEKARDILEES